MDILFVAFLHDAQVCVCVFVLFYGDFFPLATDVPFLFIGRLSLSVRLDERKSGDDEKKSAKRPFNCIFVHFFFLLKHVARTIFSILSLPKNIRLDDDETNA